MPFVSSVAPLAPAAPRAHWFLVTPAGLVVAERDGRAALPSPDEIAAIGPDAASAHYLGRLDDADCHAAGLPEGRPLPPGLVARSLRSLFGRLDDDLAAVAGRAAQIVHWDETHRFCGRCAAPTDLVAGERARRCPRCSLTAYPRVSPAVIVLVHREDEVLLARSAHFVAGVHSVLAGFVEPGESLEETIAREIREEVGVEIADPRYFGSQPWPFPHSLMIAFHARWAGGEIAIDGREIVEAGWFRAGALPPIPKPFSIARHLIDAFCDDRFARA